MFRPTRLFASITIFSAICALSPLATAQNNTQASVDGSVDEIIVSADYRQANINTIASSISVLDSTLIEQKNAQHLEDILLDAPNVNFASGASRARFFQIRGIGERGQYSAPTNPSVGVMIDGVDFSGIGNAATLYDIEQVEILMGPQGTRYGSNALAGLINLQSKAATEDFHYGIKAEAGNYQSNGLAGYISGPVSDDLLYRLSLQQIKSDGFSDNLTVNRPTNDRDEMTFRGKLHWNLSDDIKLDLTASLMDIDNGYDAFSLDNLRDTLSDEPGYDRQESKLFSANLNMNNFDNFELEAIVGFSDSDIDYGYDEDWVYVGFDPFEYSSFDLYSRERETFSTEIRLLSNENSALFSDQTSWIVGVYTLQQEVDLTRTYTYLASDFISSHDIDRLAIFADTSTRLSDNLTFDLGLRAERFDASYADSDNVNFTPDDNFFGGKVALNFMTSNDNLIYASISRGYKAGGFNINGSLDADLREFDSEQLWNYELGFKGRLLQNRLRTQIALFYMDREDVQISTSISRLRPDNSTDFIQYEDNASGGSNYGIELNTDLQATNSTSIYASLGLLQSKYDNFINKEGVNLDGREQAHAPAYQFTLGTNINFNSQLSLNVNAQAKDKFYFSDSHANQSNSYVLLNANLSYQSGPWKISLWGRNLGDRDYFVRGFGFGNDPRIDYEPTGYTQLGEPRRIGLSLNFDY